MLRAIAIAAFLVAACATAPKPTVESDPDITFYGVCYDTSGFPASFLSECGAGELVVWQLPVPVAIDPKYPHPEVARAALKWWNEQLGGTVFIETDLDDSRVLISTDGPVGPNLVGETHFMRHPVAGIFVLVAMLSNYTNDPVVIRHELGHVLGLGHDMNAVSIMHSGGKPSPRELRAEDRQALRLLYNLK